MDCIALLADNAVRNAGMLKMTLADFSEADMLVRPTPGANHAAWQLGHLVSAETRIISQCPNPKVAELPAGFADRFNKSTAGENDPSKLASKDELLALLDKVRAASAEWIKTLTPETLGVPGPEKLRFMAPTLGDIAMLIPLHTMMHVGQFQVIRRALGKPVLF